MFKNKDIPAERRLNMRRFLKALAANAGNFTQACRGAQITRPSVYNWMRDHPKFKAEVDEVKESLLDFTESKLLKLIKDNNSTAIMFYLKTQGRGRGYGE